MGTWTIASTFDISVGTVTGVDITVDYLAGKDAQSGGGDVTGPASAVNENIAVFNSTTGKLIKDGLINKSAITANTAKVGITAQQASDITTNNAKISFDSTSSTRLANTSGTNTGDNAVNSSAVAIDQTTPQTIINGNLSGSDPVTAQHFATKEYVDKSVSFVNNFYFNNTADALGGIYYKMLDLSTGEAESSFVSATVGVSTANPIVNFITSTGFPGVDTLQAGIYSGHAHAARTAGGRTCTVYYELYTCDAAGANQVLRGTSETSGEITTKGDVDLHVTIISDIDILVTDRLLIKWFANVSGGGANSAVTLYAEGTNSSHLSIPTSTEVLSSVFVRQDGTKPLTGNWNAGAFDITAQNISGTNTGDQVGDGVTITGAGTIGDPFVSAGGGLSAYKTSDQTKTNDDVSALDTDVQVQVIANSIYEFKLMIKHISHATPEMKWKFQYPTNAIPIYSDQYSGTAPQDPTLDLSILGTTSTVRMQLYSGWLFVENTAGTFGLMWSQNTTSANTTILEKGTCLILRKIK